MTPGSLCLAVGFFKPDDIRSVNLYLMRLERSKEHLKIEKKRKAFRITKAEAEKLVEGRRKSKSELAKETVSI